MMAKQSVTSASHKSVLVAEDDQFYTNIYQTKLTKEGYAVTVVTRGDLVVKKAREVKPDLILLDLIMPGKDGFEILKDLNNDPSLKRTKVIVISNLGQAEDIQKTKAMGAVDYVVKANISIGEMIQKIKSYLT